VKTKVAKPSAMDQRVEWLEAYFADRISPQDLESLRQVIEGIIRRRLSKTGGWRLSKTPGKVVATSVFDIEKIVDDILDRLYKKRNKRPDRPEFSHLTPAESFAFQLNKIIYNDVTRHIEQHLQEKYRVFDNVRTALKTRTYVMVGAEFRDTQMKDHYLPRRRKRTGWNAPDRVILRFLLHDISEWVDLQKWRGDRFPPQKAVRAVKVSFKFSEGYEKTQMNPSPLAMAVSDISNTFSIVLGFVPRKQVDLGRSHETDDGDRGADVEGNVDVESRRGLRRKGGRKLRLAEPESDSDAPEEADTGEVEEFVERMIDVGTAFTPMQLTVLTAMSDPATGELKRRPGGAADPRDERAMTNLDIAQMIGKSDTQVAKHLENASAKFKQIVATIQKSLDISLTGMRYLEKILRIVLIKCHEHVRSRNNPA